MPMVFINNGCEYLTRDSMTTLAQVHAAFQKWLYVPDTKRIDVVLATALTASTQGTPIWLILVGASGDWKTEQLTALNDPEYSKLIGRLTPNTLISGDRRAKDLAPELHNKIFLIKDMAQMLTLPPDHKAAIWAQLRDLYDGRISKATGSGSDKTYEVYTTLIAASTPAIDEQILQGQALGTRELIWRTDAETLSPEENKKVMDACLANEGHDEEMKTHLSSITRGFLHTRKFTPITPTPEIEEKLKEYALFTRMMRATGESDYDGNLRNVVYPEQPTRILKQYKRLYQALKCLEDDYSDERALAIIHHLAHSAAHRVRLNIYYTLAGMEGAKSTNWIAHESSVGYKSANFHLSILRAVGVVERHLVEEENSYGRILERVTWKMKRPVVKQEKLSA